LFASSLFARNVTGEQKIYPVDSPVHEALEYLYIAQGLSIPSTAGPWSGDELALLLSRIEKEKLSKDEVATYWYVAQKLSETIPSFTATAILSLESYIHTNTADFQENEDWYCNYAKRSPFLSVPLEISLAEKFYAFADMYLGSLKYSASDSEVEGVSTLYGTYAITTNAYNFWHDEPLSVDANIPYRAFASFGGAFWNLEVGRDALSWGPGTSGNFIFGSHLQYHNQGRFTAYGNNFKYTFATSFFPHPDEIWNSDVYSQGHALVGLKMFMAHRFEWRLFGNRLGVALNEGIMYQDEDGNIDLRIFNPFMLYHNYFIRSNANSITSLEIDFTPLKFWNIYSQLVIDELAFGEVEQNLASGRHPNGVGVMLGVKNVRPLFGGMFYANIEGVYTDPYLYLRSEDGDSNQSSSSDSLNYVVAIRRWFSDRVIYDQTFMGYQYGGNAIVGNLAIGFEKFGNWSAEGRVFAMIHGNTDENTFWTKDSDGLTPLGAATITLDLGLSGSKLLNGKWRVYGGIDWISIYSDSVFSHDFQLNMGMAYSLR
jgi:hypothetical protein